MQQLLESCAEKRVCYRRSHSIGTAHRRAGFYGYGGNCVDAVRRYQQIASALSTRLLQRIQLAVYACVQRAEAQ
jgi:hypothetical protein